jgi:hypothetical protein
MSSRIDYDDNIFVYQRQIAVQTTLSRGLARLLLVLLLPLPLMINLDYTLRVHAAKI